MTENEKDTTEERGEQAESGSLAETLADAVTDTRGAEGGNLQEGNLPEGCRRSECGDNREDGHGAEHGTDRGDSRRAEYCGKELILIAISASSRCPQVIRAAVRLARELSAPVKAVYVETQRVDTMEKSERRILEENMRLAKALGASLIFGYGTDVAGQIIETANVTGATKLFLGFSGKTVLSRRENLGVRIKKRMPSLDIYMIPGTLSGKKDGKLDINTAIRAGTYRKKSPFILFLALFAVMLVCTFLALTARHFGTLYVDIVIIYLFGVLGLSMIGGSLLFIAGSSLTAVLLVNYFFVEPLYGFYYSKPADFTSFLLMFLMAFTISFLMGRFQKELESNHKTAMRTDILFDCSTLLLLARSEEEVDRTIAEELFRLVRMSVVIYKKDTDGRLLPPAYYARPGISVSQMYPIDNATDREAVETVFATGMRAGSGTAKQSGARAVYLPIKYGDTVYAAAGLYRMDGKDIPAFEFGILNSMLNEAGLVYARIRGEND